MPDDTPVTHAILREELKSAAQLFTDLKESLERQIRDIEKSPERPFRRTRPPHLKSGAM
jgi:hypothetical protein